MNKDSESNIFSNTGSYKDYIIYILSVFLASSDIKKPQEVIADFSYEKFFDVLRKNKITLRTYRALMVQNLIDDNKLVKRIVAHEENRIKSNIEIIEEIYQVFNKEKKPLLLIKTMDNYPDFGHDLDFYIHDRNVDVIMDQHFQVKREKRTFFEVLANKRNYVIQRNNYKVLLEFHCKKLGQCGEDNLLLNDLVNNKVEYSLSQVLINIPRLEHRLLIRVMQRMYRHFNFRICDIVNTVNEIKSNTIDWDYLIRISKQMAIYEGVADFLSYIQRVCLYFDCSLDIKASILNDGKVNQDLFSYENKLLNIPVFSESFKLYFFKFINSLGKINLIIAMKIVFLMPFLLLRNINWKIYKREILW
jgi:hypothetical protein